MAPCPHLHVLQCSASFYLTTGRWKLEASTEAAGPASSEGVLCVCGHTGAVLKHGELLLLGVKLYTGKLPRDYCSECFLQTAEAANIKSLDLESRQIGRAVSEEHGLIAVAPQIILKDL